MTRYLSTIWLALLGLVACRKDDPTPTPAARLFWQPANFPAPSYDFANNPITAEKVALGKKLFYDGILSRDGTISCGSCHQQPSGFTQHGHRLSHGIEDRLTMRNSQPIQNLAWSNSFFWDGGVLDLDLFAVAPIENPHEMDETMSNVLDKLRAHREYPTLFREAFGSEGITTDRFLKALAQFQLVCISAGSRYDLYRRQENGITLDPTEQLGLQVFQSKCAACHSGELFTDRSFRNNGIARAQNPADSGRARITLDQNDAFKFRVPSLRNVVYTAPYMHDGRISTLEGVLDHYAAGVESSATLDPALRQPDGRLGIPLTDAEKAQIIAFLHTLTDTVFLTRRDLAEY